MSKNALYLVVVCALAITGLSFFVSRNGAPTCTVNNALGGDQSAFTPKNIARTGAEEIHATVHGYPYWYYQEPFPANCISRQGTSSLTGLNMNHLGSDLLIWLLVSLAVTLGAAGLKAWRGPKMLGDNVRRA
jgi:hypothetical protein